MDKFTSGDKVMIKEGSVKAFLNKYIGQTLTIAGELVTPTKYYCYCEDGKLVPMSNWAKEYRPYSFKPDQLVKAELVATPPTVGSRVFLGLELDSSDEEIDFIEHYHYRTFEIEEYLEDEDKVRLKDVPFLVKAGNIYKGKIVE